MSWKRSKTADYPGLVRFILENEWCCAALSAKILSSQTISLPPWCTLFHLEKEGHIAGILLHSPRGSALPVIADDYLPASADIADLSLFLRQRGNVYSIMGMRHAVEIIEKSVNQEPKSFVDYYIMKRDTQLAKPPDIPSGITISQAGPKDTQALFPLQKAYELEEVVLCRSDYNVKASLSLFRKNLKRNLVYFLSANGKIIAKAGTNARGQNYYQIGGVYTRKNERSKRYAYLLLEHMLWEFGKMDKNAVLFVKKTNLPAIKLYQNLQFHHQGDFRISYFSL